MFKDWQDQVLQFRFECSRRTRDMVPKPEIGHADMRDRLDLLMTIRGEHEELRKAITHVASFDTKLLDSSILPEIEEAYQQLTSVDVLDASPEGKTRWQEACKAYTFRVDQVELQIRRKLGALLDAANTEEKFRILSRYRELFARRGIHDALAQGNQRELMKRVEQDIKALLAKQYNGSDDARMSRVRDLPPLSGYVVWARQIERRLDQQLHRVESVLGKKWQEWEQRSSGTNLKKLANAVRKKIDPKAKFNEWHKKQEKKKGFDSTRRIFDVTTDTKSDELNLVVDFDPEEMTLFKEFRNLEWLGLKPRMSLKFRSLEAKEKYPYVIALQDSLRIYKQTSMQIDDSIKILVANAITNVQKCLAKAVQEGITWDDTERLAVYTKKVSSLVLGLQKNVAELKQTRDEVEQHCKNLDTCEYSHSKFAEVLSQIQKLVDNMNLTGYSNIKRWVKDLDERIEKCLVRRVESKLADWTTKMGDLLRLSETAGKSRRNAKDTEEKEQTLVKELKLPEIIHEVLLTDRVLQLSPSISESRVEQFAEVHKMLSEVLDQKRIRSMSFEQTFDVTEAVDLSADRDEEERRKQSYTALLQRIAPAILSSAYTAIENQLQAVDDYSAKWLQYQALWDMEANAIFAELGESVEKWHLVLSDIRRTRKTFANPRPSKRFGNVVVDFHSVQEKVNHKYDVWHKELLAKFGDLLGQALISFNANIVSLKSKLETLRLDCSTAEIVDFITLLQNVKMKLSGWSTEMERFSKAQSLLDRQRYSFPPDWLWFDQVQGEWEALTQILQRQDQAVKSEIPSLQAKILAEEKMLNKKIATLAADWAQGQPLKGDIKPSDALERIAVMEGIAKRAMETIAQIKIAKKALQLDPPSDERLVVCLEEMSTLKEVWQSVAEVWKTIDELAETAWTSVVPKKVRRALSGLDENLSDLPNHVRTYEAFTYVQSRVQEWKRVNSTIRSKILSSGMGLTPWTHRVT